MLVMRQLAHQALRIVQESRGWIDREAIRDLAQTFDLHPMEVEEVATFYTMINLRPVGKFHLQVCRSISCRITSRSSPSWRVLMAAVEEGRNAG